ncbi:MAG: IS4 family transposase, partial [Aeoliella sp.]
MAKLADQMCLRPGGTLPQKFRSPADLQAFYRLMRKDDVTHEAILDAHRQATYARIESLNSPVLILHDSTELEYTTHKSLDTLGPIGSGKRRGYITHNSLAVDPMARDVLGLCNQVLHRRADVGKSETRAQRHKRKSRESLLWLKGTQPLPASRQLIDICDRGADTFEFLEHEMTSRRRFVIRSSYDRCVFLGHDRPDESESGKLRQYVRTLPQAGSWTLQVTSKAENRSPKRNGKKKLVVRKKREANMAVAFAPVQVKPSKCHKGSEPLNVWIVRVWEVDPPKGQERLEWMLITNEPVQSFEAAYRVVGWYECRWIIEEYHKGMKTGCQIESPQFTTEDRLQPAIALLSVITLTLLELRQASRRPDAKTRKATTVIGTSYVDVLSQWRHKTIKRDWTIHDFYYALARLGGHQNRKHDHPPGW